MAAEQLYPRNSIEDDFNYGSNVASASVHIRMGRGCSGGRVRPPPNEFFHLAERPLLPPGPRGCRTPVLPTSSSLLTPSPVAFSSAQVLRNILTFWVKAVSGKPGR